MYNLHTLGWHDFQKLCLTIAREIFGQTIESYLDAADGGRDGAFAGVWQDTSGEELSGAFVIQCKFTSKLDSNLLASDLKEEVNKVKQLVKKGLCDSYLIMTNAGISGNQAANIVKQFMAVGVKNVRVYGHTWLTQQIQESKRLRMLVPRVYGLGDLSQILDERSYAQARYILEALRDDLARVVVTDSYRRAAEALNNHGFVLLIGEPAAGKTTIAALLAMGALDQWQAAMLKPNSPEEVVERWNPDEPAQLFWIDDAFGVTQYEGELVRRWNHSLPVIKSMIQKGAKIVMTSRDYIYNRARRELKEGVFPLLKEGQVVIDVHELTYEEKSQILYNHLKLGKQTKEYLKHLKPNLPMVAKHERFVPETARRLGDPAFTRHLKPWAISLERFVAQREQHLKEVIQGLDSDSKAALGLIYISGGMLATPIVLGPDESEALSRLGSDLGNAITALDALKGSLVLHSTSNSQPHWSFKHPTIGDAYGSLIAESPDLLGIYLRGTSAELMITQITCGDIGLENALIVPAGLFELVRNRLERFLSTGLHKTEWLASFSAKRSLLYFLSTRTSKEFLISYIDNNPAILDRLGRPGLYLDTAPEVRLISRLKEFGLLSEKVRIEFIKTVSEYAIEGRDVAALGDPIVTSVFTDKEQQELREAIRIKLLPRLDQMRESWESDYSSDESPDSHMLYPLQNLSILRKAYEEDEEIITDIEHQDERIRDWISAHNVIEDEISDRVFGEIEVSPELTNSRNIFDDIDE